MSTLMQWAEALENTSVGLSIAESRYAFAIIEGAHLIGLSVSVGLIFITDLRLMGLLFRRQRVSRLNTERFRIKVISIILQITADKPLRGSRYHILEVRISLIHDVTHPLR